MTMQYISTSWPLLLDNNIIIVCGYHTNYQYFNFLFICPFLVILHSLILINLDHNYFDHIDNYLLLVVPGDGVKGKTWGPSSALSNVKQRPTITETQNRWKAISAPSLEKGSPRNLANIPTVGTVPEGEYPSD